MAAACGGDEEGGAVTSSTGLSPAVAETVVVRASSDLAVGTERLLMALASSSGGRLGSPDTKVSMLVFPAEDPQAAQEVDAKWIWAIPEVSGLYRATVVFDRAGTWLAELSVDGEVLVPVAMTVAANPLTPAVGTPAPASDTPTAADVADLADITTDSNPDPDLYQLSVADAVGSGRPSVVVFATPKFCETAICGPTLETIKEMKVSFPGVNFVHVEVFDLGASGDAASIEDLVVHPAVLEWGLPSEPWVFVVDSDGTVMGRFEGVVAPEEIEALIG